MGQQEAHFTEQLCILLELLFTCVCYYIIMTNHHGANLARQVWNIMKSRKHSEKPRDPTPPPKATDLPDMIYVGHSFTESEN